MTGDKPCEPYPRYGLGPFYQDVIAVSPLEPWDAAAAAYRPGQQAYRAEACRCPSSGARLTEPGRNP